MAERAANLPPRYLRTPEAARFLGLSGRTLEKHRTYGTGPDLPQARRPRRLCPRRPSGLGGSRSPRPPPPIPASALFYRPSAKQPRPPPSGRARADGGRPMSCPPQPNTMSASSSICSARCPAISRRAMRRISWPIRSSRSPSRSAWRRSTSGRARSTIRVEAVPEHGMATIWDADVLIWAASQIVEARDAGLRTSRLMAATPYEILNFIGRGVSAARLRPAQGRARPAAIDHRRDLDPPADRAAACIASPGSTNGRSAPTPRPAARPRADPARLVLRAASSTTRSCSTIDRAYFD